ncbi:MAG: DUF3467 domain-containing protein [Prevotella sp.]|nr:DUF3467 domain-containing protein [Prevotella sp.]
MSNNNQAPQLQIDLSPEKASGVYSNFAIISHSHAEFIVDFASTLPGTPKAQVVSRIVLAPEHAKRLAMAMQENVMRYEQEYGKIDLNAQPAMQGAAPKTANPFGSSQGEA